MSMCIRVIRMLYTRKEISKTYASTYQLNKVLEDKKIFKIQNGIYSDEEYVNPLAVITKKYPSFIFTMDSAFYYWDLTDVIPDRFCLATKQTSIRFKDEDIKQYFVDNDVFELGKTTLTVENVEINIYDKEKFSRYIKDIIFDDDSMSVHNIDEVIVKMEHLFSDKIFIANLKDVRNNWLDIPVDAVLGNILKFLERVATEVNVF